MIAASAPAAAQNIVVIMGDDIGVWNIGAYHRGMIGRTPNLHGFDEFFGYLYHLDAIGRPPALPGSLRHPLKRT